MGQKFTKEKSSLGPIKEKSSCGKTVKPGEVVTGCWRFEKFGSVENYPRIKNPDGFEWIKYDLGESSDMEVNLSAKAPRSLGRKTIYLIIKWPDGFILTLSITVNVVEGAEVHL